MIKELLELSKYNRSIFVIQDNSFKLPLKYEFFLEGSKPLFGFIQEASWEYFLYIKEKFKYINWYYENGVLIGYCYGNLLRIGIIKHRSKLKRG